jgi:uncharacterized membrane protein YebE (DUF533 family)
MKRLTLSADACVETLTLLIAMAHADGKLDDTERAGVRAAASIFNLERELRDRIEALLLSPAPLTELIVEHLSHKERAFAFVAAAWMTGLDASVHAEETAMLAHVANAFGFDAKEQAELAALAHQVAPCRTSKSSWSTELVELFKAIPTWVEAAAEAVDSEPSVEIVFDGPGLIWR